MSGDWRVFEDIETFFESTCKISKKSFKSSPVCCSWSMKKLRQFVNSKCDVGTCKFEVLKASYGCSIISGEDSTLLNDVNSKHILIKQIN